jgi:hypothetical protein
MNARTAFLARPWTSRWTAALFILALPAFATAQDVRVFFSDAPNYPDKGVRIDQLQVRPSTPTTPAQELFLYVENTGDKKAAVSVQLRVGDKPLSGADWKVEVDPRKVARVGGEAPKPGAPEKPPKLEEIPDGELAVVILDEKGEVQRAATKLVQIARPANYVNVDVGNFEPPLGRFSATVTAKPNFTGPRSPVELDIRPEHIPFLARPQRKSGTLGGMLFKPGDRVDLLATGLRVVPAGGDQGLVYIQVDGDARAFTFRINRAGGKPTPLEGAALRLVADSEAAPGPASKVAVEADNIPAGYTIELGMYRDRACEHPEGEVFHFKGDRRPRLFAATKGPLGGILFHGEAQDWITDIDTAKVFGTRYLRVRLLEDDSKKPVAFIKVNADGTTERATEIRAGMFLDGNLPDVAFGDFPKEQVRGTPLTVEAIAKADSGIKQVVFFVGKPGKDGKLPANAPMVEAEQVPGKDVWVAQLPAPTDKPAKIDVTVQATSKVDLSATAIVTIKLVDAKPGAASIKGVVVEGDRPQPGLEVVLRDPQGVPKDTVKSDDKGVFLFKNVAPGTYQIVVVKGSDNTQGAVAVQVAAGEEKVLAEPVKLTR